MTELIKHFWMSFTGSDKPKDSDFSAFFEKKSGDKAKLIRQVLREANEEQRRMVEEYRHKEMAH